MLLRAFDDTLELPYFPRTIQIHGREPWNMVETLETTGSVVTTLSTMGMTIVKAG